ncbi:MAG: DNA internalization-related competence protein ComEC/Rec2, partial [Acidobacteria bacterium]|nr:DNA internalization-related competence protein ComEC/Rec2 [Acidobacteriota bacterium]
LHIGIIIFILYFIFVSFRFNPFIADFAVLSFLSLYFLIVKDQPSVVRAVIMAFIFIISRMFSRQSISLNSIAIALVIMLAFNPLQINDAGFQLTFLATIGIVSLYPARPKFFRENSLWDYIFKLFWIGFSAQIFTTPVLVYSFQRISPLSFFATPIATLFLIPLLAFGIIFIFGGSLFPFINSILLFMMKIFAKFFLAVPFYFSKFTFSSLFFPRPHLIYIFLFAFCLFFIIFFKNRIYYALIFIFLVITSYNFPNPFQKIRNDCLITMDVGQGNCSLLHCGGKNYLIDCADTSYHSLPTARSVIEPLLSFFNITKIDGIFLTHWDKDHSGSLKEILTDIKIGFVAFAARPDPNLEMADYLSKKQIKKLSLGRGDTIKLEGLFIDIYNPDFKENVLNENNLSLVFSAQIRSQNIIFTGDIEKEGQKDIFENALNLNKASIFYVPHHGAKNSFFPPFIQKINPEIAIISVGKNNRFNHPNPIVLNYYKSMGSKILRTDNDGAILIVFRNDNPSIFKYSNSKWEKEIFK